MDNQLKKTADVQPEVKAAFERRYGSRWEDNTIHTQMLWCNAWEDASAALASDTAGAPEAAAYLVTGLNGSNEEWASAWIKRANADEAAARLYRAAVTPLYADPVAPAAAKPVILRNAHLDLAEDLYVDGLLLINCCIYINGHTVHVKDEQFIPKGCSFFQSRIDAHSSTFVSSAPAIVAADAAAPSESPKKMMERMTREWAALTPLQQYAIAKGRKQQEAQPDERAAFEKIATKIHYPACWDTAAYPTLASALVECAQWYEWKCGECASQGDKP
jgi:hypothetical protein